MDILFLVRFRKFRWKNKLIILVMVELKVNFVCFKWNCINFDDAFESNAASPFLYFVFRILNLDEVQ